MNVNSVDDGPEGLKSVLDRFFKLMFFISRSLVYHVSMIASVLNLITKFSIPGSPFQKICTVYVPALDALIRSVTFCIKIRPFS